MQKDFKQMKDSIQIPFKILDLLIPQLPEAELRVYLYVARRTIGFRKFMDRISLSQFTDGIIVNGEQKDLGTGMKKPAVIKALKNLKIVGLIKTESRSEGKYYGLNPIDSESDFKKILKALKKSERDRLAGLPKQQRLLPRRVVDIPVDSVGRG